MLLIQLYNLNKWVYLEYRIDGPTVAGRTVNEGNHDWIEQVNTVRQFVNVHKHGQVGKRCKPSSMAFSTSYNCPAHAQRIRQAQYHDNRNHIHVANVPDVRDQCAHSDCCNG